MDGRLSRASGFWLGLGHHDALGGILVDFMGSGLYISLNRFVILKTKRKNKSNSCREYV
jgi:hypothetical protein